MECSVNSLLLSKNGESKPLEKGKRDGASARIKAKGSFKNQFAKIRPRTAAGTKEQQAEHKVIQHSDRDTIGRKNDLSATKSENPDSMGHDLPQAIASTLQQADPEQSGEPEQAAESLLALPIGLQALLTESNPGSGEQAQPNLPSTAGTVLVDDSPQQLLPDATPTAGQPNSAAGAEMGNEETPKAGQPDRFRLMLHNNKNHVFLKLQLHQDSVAQVEKQDQPTPPGQAKKLLDFETHRLAGAKLPGKSSSLQEQSGLQQSGEKADAKLPGQSSSPPEQTSPQQSGEKADNNLTITVKESPGGSRVMIRSLPHAGGNAAPMPQTEEVFAQIVDRAKLMVKLSSSEMNIDLKPEFLGKLSIKVMVEDGLVTARFLTDNHHVKQMLESNLNTLRQNLESQGLKVDKTEVEVQLGNDQNSDSPGNWQEEGWAKQQALQSNPVLPLDETGLAVLDAENLADNNLADIYEYSANGQMNILV